MAAGRYYLAELARMHSLADLDERRRVARQGLAMLAQIAEREPAALEGLPADQLLLSVRAALTDGSLADLDWLSPASAAIALFELAQAIPPGGERRELGRRVLQRLRSADRETLVLMLVVLARSSPKLLASDFLRARAEVLLSAPLTAPTAIGELALAILAQPTLAASWVEAPAMGSLPARRLAGRILAHGAREAIRRHDAGDRGGVAVLARPGLRKAMALLLGDREALVWRFASVARGLLAHVDTDFAADIDRELRPSAGPSALRRGAASAAVALERGGAATRWEAILLAAAATEPGVVRGSLLGLAGLAMASPDDADRIATALMADATANGRHALDACEALAELRREEAVALLPKATAIALVWTRRQLQIATQPNADGRGSPAAGSAAAGQRGDIDGRGSPAAGSAAAGQRGDADGRGSPAAGSAAAGQRGDFDGRGSPAAGSAAAGQRGDIDDSQLTVLQALDAELGADPRASEGLGQLLAAARTALDAGDAVGALREARAAVDELAGAADWLERATDDDAIDRRHSLRLLRELDRELLADSSLPAIVALAPEGDPVRAQLQRAMSAIEAALLAREATAETGAVQYGGLRVARLRALVRLLDGAHGGGDAALEPRLAAVRQLMARAGADRSSLRRAVWAAMTRAGDALLRDDHAEITDLLLAWTTTFVDEDFAIVREATMVPEIEAAFEAYALLQRTTWDATDPDDTEAAQAIAARVGELADALPPERSARVEAVRLALARLGNLFARVTQVGSHDSVGPGAFDAIASELGALSRRSYGARRRLGAPAEDFSSDLEAGTRAVGMALESQRGQPTATRALDALEQASAYAIEIARHALPPALASALERVLVWLARRPASDADASAPPQLEQMLPPWVPLSRLLGGFYVVRPIGRGAGGSVLLAVRTEERLRPDRELVAVKVPDYSGAAARTLSEAEFEALFREEAGALLALPQHGNLAGFITFDASARPKPILVMEFVRGVTLERALEGELDMARALAIIDGVLAGLEAMHRVQIAHLDVKPANVVLRDSDGDAVLVDFGLAGRRLRTGCGSVHYGAAEVWAEAKAEHTPFPADVYAAACIAYEIITNRVLVNGETMKDVIDQHFAAEPGRDQLARLERAHPMIAPLAQLLRAAVARDPKRRPTISRLRAGFAAIAPDIRSLPWPIQPKA